jgi:transglycosylase-like protein with SLT domain
MPVKGAYLLIAGTGGLLLWSGLKGKSWTSVARDIIAGKKPQASLTAYAIAPGAAVPSPGSGGGGTTAPLPMGKVTHAKNVANGRIQAAAYGWVGSQWTDLYNLWTKESGWNNLAQNPSSTAYGIAQFLDTTWAGYGPKTSNPTLQIRYGLKYIRQRYGSPAAAWAHEVANNWY